MMMMLLLSLCLNRWLRLREMMKLEKWRRLSRRRAKVAQLLREWHVHIERTLIVPDVDE